MMLVTVFKPTIYRKYVNNTVDVRLITKLSNAFHKRGVLFHHHEIFNNGQIPVMEIEESMMKTLATTCSEW